MPFSPTMEFKGLKLRLLEKPDELSSAIMGAEPQLKMLALHLNDILQTHPETQWVVQTVLNGDGVYLPTSELYDKDVQTYLERIRHSFIPHHIHAVPVKSLFAGHEEQTIGIFIYFCWPNIGPLGRKISLDHLKADAWLLTYTMCFEEHVWTVEEILKEKNPA